MMISTKVFHRIVAASLLSALTAGCVLFPGAKDKALRRTPAFQEGYSDGCAAASAQGSNYREGPYRDEALYQSDAAYRAGWSNGFQTCRPAQPGNSPVPGANPIPSPVPGP
jgi:hypothetical protein